MISTASLAKAIPIDVALTDEERSAVLETALLAIASDGVIDATEAAAFLAIAERLGADGAPLLVRFESGLTRDQADARLLEVAKHLGSPASRTLAYRTAYALSLADHEASDGEFEFDLQLLDALDLSQAEADRLVAEVDAAVA
jgi:tellurite resistance protein